MKKLLLPFAAALALAGCATPTRYAPAMSPSDVGYHETQIEPERYRVTFHGGSGADAARVNDLALLRAAELTLQHGYDWFRVIGRSTDMAAPSGPQFSFGFGGASFGRHSAVGAGVGTTTGGDATFVANLEIQLGRGPNPGGPEVYDARSVVSSLRPTAPAG